jgi:hypothetical protein
VAGDPGVGAFDNWNNMTSGTALNSLVLSNGNVTGVNLSVFTGATGAGTHPVASPFVPSNLYGINNWAGGIVIGNSFAAPIGGSAANQKMMATGARSFGNDANNGLGGGAIIGNNLLTFTGLSSVFTSGYKVYIYQDAGSGNVVGSGSGPGWASFSGSTTGTFPDGIIAYAAPTGQGAASQVNNNAFNNDFGINNHETLMTLVGSLDITSDTFTINSIAGHYLTGQVHANNIAGIQIVGEVADVVVPEPSIWPLLALCGVGTIFGYLYFRRRRRATK